MCVRRGLAALPRLPFISSSCRHLRGNRSLCSASPCFCIAMSPWVSLCAPQARLCPRHCQPLPAAACKLCSQDWAGSTSVLVTPRQEIFICPYKEAGVSFPYLHVLGWLRHLWGISSPWDCQFEEKQHWPHAEVLGELCCTWSLHFYHLLHAHSQGQGRLISVSLDPAASGDCQGQEQRVSCLSQWRSWIPAEEPGCVCPHLQHGALQPLPAFCLCLPPGS